MKRKKSGKRAVAKRVGVCVGAAAVSAAMLTGCSWFQRPVPALYGPPPTQEDNYDPANNVPEDVYGPPPFEEDYDPEQELIETVYGPPEWFESDYDPEEELPAPVYGPPEWFESENATPAPEGENP